MPDRGLRDLYIDELKDLYSAEKQLTKALPKFAAKQQVPSTCSEETRRSGNIVLDLGIGWRSSAFSPLSRKPINSFHYPTRTCDSVRGKRIRG
jgi:hypothetical protein